MTEEHQLPCDSDEDDEDYVPDGIDSNPISEAESEAVESESESGTEEENDENQKQSAKKKGKKRNRVAKLKIQKRRKILSKKASDENGDKDEKEMSKEEKQLTEEEEKKRADSLWADFMKDTATISMPISKTSKNKPEEKSVPLEKPFEKPKIGEKVKITKVFEFAGEEVKVEKEVAVDSAEARLSLSSAENSTKTEDSAPPAGRGGGRGRVIRRTGLGGISSVLGQLGKKAKISTLEKSKLDWDNFKKQENLEEEISTYNKGKDGYLERQDFLQRADLRQFELEKQLRNSSRRNTR